MRHSPKHEAIHGKTTAKHRRIDDSAGFKLRLQWPTVTRLRSIGANKAALAVSVLTCLALGALASGPATSSTNSDQMVAVSDLDRAYAQAATRSMDRQSAGSSTEDSAVVDVLKSPEQKAREEAARKAAEAKKAAEAQAAAAAEAA